MGAVRVGERVGERMGERMGVEEVHPIQRLMIPQGMLLVLVWGEVRWVGRWEGMRGGVCGGTKAWEERGTGCGRWVLGTWVLGYFGT